MGKRNYIYIFFSLLIILLILSHKTFSFPYYNLQSTNLTDGSYLFVHKYGIDIVDYNLEKVIKVIVFSDEEQINDLKNIIIKQFEDGYVICLINDKIYIFNKSGHLRYKSEKINDDKEVNYYSLNIYDNYHYYIGLINDDSLHLYYYEYNDITKKAIKMAESVDFKIVKSYLSGYPKDYYEFVNGGLNCHIMINVEKGETLVCFLIVIDNDLYYISINFYHINNGNIIENENYEQSNTNQIINLIT